METPRVFITGIGLATALGPGRETSWRRLREGHHGFRRLPEGVGAPADFGIGVFEPGRGPGRVLIQAANEVIEDAKLERGTFDPGRAAVVAGVSKGDLLGNLRHEADWSTTWPNLGARLLSTRLDFRGPCLAPIAACATGMIAALRGAELIRRGVCDLALVGAADASLEPFHLAAFQKMRVLARVGDDPGRAVRPWDRLRSGFLVGEGAALLVLEREDHARARGVLPHAEFSGGACGADAYHMTDLNPDPSNLAGLIGRALAASGVEPWEIDHVNVHGTATRGNDPLECRSLRVALGEHADKVACSANKAQIGHTLGAAGAVELAFTALAIRDGFVPPTLNLDDPDPLCDLDGTPHVGRPLPIRAALKLSIGFGGHLAAAVLRQVDGPRRDPS